MRKERRTPFLAVHSAPAPVCNQRAPGGHGGGRRRSLEGARAVRMRLFQRRARSETRMRVTKAFHSVRALIGCRRHRPRSYVVCSICVPRSALFVIDCALAIVPALATIVERTLDVVQTQQLRAALRTRCEPHCAPCAHTCATFVLNECLHFSLRQTACNLASAAGPYQQPLRRTPWSERLRVYVYPTNCCRVHLPTTRGPPSKALSP